MRGVARSGLFKSHGLDKSSGAPTAELPAGVDASSAPVIVGINAIFYNPKSLGFGSITPTANISAALRANLKNIAVSSPSHPQVMVALSVYYTPNINLAVKLLYSRYSNFPGFNTEEKNIIVPANSGITFSLNNLLPGTTYYLKAQAASFETPSVIGEFAPNSPIIINTPVAPVSGLFGGFYFIGGQATSLNIHGTGEWDGVYYINGVATNLINHPTLGWSGVYNGQQYYYGALAHSLINDQWWYHGCAVTEFFFNGGNGIGLGGLFYQNFSVFTGVHEGVRYKAGLAAPELDLDGNGTIDQILHVAGMPYTGDLQGVYYINGQTTELGAGGTGIWNGQYFSGGVFIGNVGNPYDSGQTSGQGSRFSEGVTYG
jgi:hypothetical protein